MVTISLLRGHDKREDVHRPIRETEEINEASEENTFTDMDFNTNFAPDDYDQSTDLPSAVADDHTTEYCKYFLNRFKKKFFFNTISVSSHMYPENPEGTQVIVGSMNMGYISDTARN